MADGLGVEELLDMLFEMIDEAKSMPLSSDKCILERDKALDLLDEIRAPVPMELAEAKSSSLPGRSISPPPSGRGSSSASRRRRRHARWCRRTSRWPRPNRRQTS